MSEEEKKDHGVPKILYLDDEQYNLDVFEFALPEDWEIHTSTNPMQAMAKPRWHIVLLRRNTLCSETGWQPLSNSSWPGAAVGWIFTPPRRSMPACVSCSQSIPGSNWIESVVD